MPKKEFNKYPESTNIKNILFTKEMTKIYDEKLAGGSARSYYDKIKLSVEDEKCLFCQKKNISEIDHFLPKEKYLHLALTPINLIPICKDCNFIKRSHIPTAYHDILFNPYFDNFDDHKWLVACISKTLPLRVSFKVDTQIPIDPNDIKRIQTTFKKLNLSQIYKIEANTELNNMKFSWKNLYAKKGSTGLYERLIENAESRKHYKRNSWQTALYEGLSKSPWFYEDLIKDW